VSEQVGANVAQLVLSFLGGAIVGAGIAYALGSRRFKETIVVYQPEGVPLQKIASFELDPIIERTMRVLNYE
jgi:membrane protein DedA with SNARE-associated domain